MSCTQVSADLIARVIESAHAGSLNIHDLEKSFKAILEANFADASAPPAFPDEIKISIVEPAKTVTKTVAKATKATKEKKEKKEKSEDDPFTYNDAKSLLHKELKAENPLMVEAANLEYGDESWKTANLISRMNKMAKALFKDETTNDRCKEIWIEFKEQQGIKL